MPTVQFKLAGQAHEISCAEGEQEKIRELAVSVNHRIDQFSRSFGAVSPALIVAVTVLMMEDEIRTLKESQDHTDPLAVGAAQAVANQNDAINLAVVEAIEPITRTIEVLAKKLKK